MIKTVILQCVNHILKTIIFNFDFLSINLIIFIIKTLLFSLLYWSKPCTCISHRMIIQLIAFKICVQLCNSISKIVFNMIIKYLFIIGLITGLNLKNWLENPFNNRNLVYWGSIWFTKNNFRKNILRKILYWKIFYEKRRERKEK